jgi:hypothetical protein
MHAAAARGARRDIRNGPGGLPMPELSAWLGVFASANSLAGTLAFVSAADQDAVELVA